MSGLRERTYMVFMPVFRVRKARPRAKQRLSSRKLYTSKELLGEDIEELEYHRLVVAEKQLRDTFQPAI
jgi:hypothetical protein